MDITKLSIAEKKSIVDNIFKNTMIKSLTAITHLFPRFTIKSSEDGLHFSEGYREWTPLEIEVDALKEPTRMSEIANFQLKLTNSRYIVLVRRWNDDMMWLSIRNHRNNCDRDWRDFQRIKNELCGTKCDAIEIYPSEDKLVDTSNQFHLWVFQPSFDMPIGYQKRDVLTPEQLAIEMPKACQRPFQSHQNDTDLPEVGWVWKRFGVTE